ncbi:hypothetical protein G6O67_004150 [Ophiocordyceps sinensis]|uniref:Uncharacterized protein n=1 Tax=Ophiocordyceps sinensis TaxID=72228 RepID=A0A8H4LZK1_9HYPO|nr:hypothetical protein G6O67_004150 [Ophiocordyceps sinensis]
MPVCRCQPPFSSPQPYNPHKAALASDEFVKPVPSDHALLAKCREYAVECAARQRGWLFVESAGGVHSPSPSGKSTQADVYRPLRIPTILIGDSGLGGISQTISAFESLLLRGYRVESVLLFENARFENHAYLGKYFQEHHRVPVFSTVEPPKRGDDAGHDAEAMAEYYGRAEATRVLKHLNARHDERINALEALPERAHKSLWYPFTQQSLLSPADIMTIDSAHGDYFQTLAPRASDDGLAPLLGCSFDGSASWFTQGLGHSNPRLTLAAAKAAGRYGHVMFAGAVHEPAMELAETLLDAMDNPRFHRVFYSDNGSTGNEVALKMALRAARLRYRPDETQQLGVLGLSGGYHGDTLGALDCAEPSMFNDKVEWYEAKGFWFDYPTVLCSNGEWSVDVDNDGLRAELGHAKRFSSLDDIFDVETRERLGEHRRYETYITGTLSRLRQQGRRFGALILEPVVLGAGGMALVDPLFQRTLVNVVRQSPHLLATSSACLPPTTTKPHDWTGLPVIFDEVFTGLYRLGRRTPSSFLGVQADVSVHAKLLTGGLVPLCATLASESIFDVFSGPDKADALLHGHSYTAHPVGCQVALESLREMQAMERRGDWDWAKRQGWTGEGSLAGGSDRQGVWSVWPREFVESLSRPSGRVRGVWALGSVLAIHLQDSVTGYSSNAAVGLRDALRRRRDGSGANVHSRVLGNVLYLMASQTTTQSTIEQLTELVEESLSKCG